MNRRLAGICTIAVVLLAGAGYVGWTVWRQRPASAATGGLDPARSGTLLYVDEAAGDRRVGQVAPGGEAATGDLRCLRMYSAGGTTICLRALTVPAGFEALLLDRNLAKIRTVRVDGTPSRARVSASGRLVAWTVFRSGDSYDPGRFSTTAGIYDTADRKLYGSLEDFTLTVDGAPYDRPDVNFWGVTFAADDRTFYATLGSAGRTWLLRGDLRTRTLTAIHENAECPAVSPDGTRVAYKKRGAGGAWRLHVLDLASGQEVALAETANVDDQAVWFDPTTVGYATTPAGARHPAVFAVPADGSGAPRLVRPDASSPAPLT
ncbi:hypothetical protein AB0M43_05385 [Longispora sp. NPDC051575]|uniref:hypothetical protein n=1 Tax=Longispora sp. NPDC051575 TaxID=3154943 RepID=UPI00342EE350